MELNTLNMNINVNERFISNIQHFFNVKFQPERQPTKSVNNQFSLSEVSCLVICVSLNIILSLCIFILNDHICGDFHGWLITWWTQGRWPGMLQIGQSTCAAWLRFVFNLWFVFYRAKLRRPSDCLVQELVKLKTKVLTLSRGWV